jgi:hypothetical protein
MHKPLFDTAFMYSNYSTPVVLAPSSSEELSLPLSLADSELGALPNSAPAPAYYIQHNTYKRCTCSGVSSAYCNTVNTERVNAVV